MQSDETRPIRLTVATTQCDYTCMHGSECKGPRTNSHHRSFNRARIIFFIKSTHSKSIVEIGVTGNRSNALAEIPLYDGGALRTTAAQINLHELLLGVVRTNEVISYMPRTFALVCRPSDSDRPLEWGHGMEPDCTTDQNGQSARRQKGFRRGVRAREPLIRWLSGNHVILF